MYTHLFSKVASMSNGSNGNDGNYTHHNNVYIDILANYNSNALNTET